MALRHGERPPPWPPPARPACARPALSQNGYGLRLVPLENPKDCWSHSPCADDRPGPGGLVGGHDPVQAPVPAPGGS